MREFYLRLLYIISKAKQVVFQSEEAGRILKAARVFAKSLLTG